MLYVPVVSSIGKPLMPCHPARARELVQKGRAVRRFDKGIFYIRLLDRKKGEKQLIAVGIDPGSRKEGISVKSKSRTYMNIQLDAVTWVKKYIETRRMMRRNRRQRKTPYRKNRMNRSRGCIPPSTKARWQWKLRICRWLSKYFPIKIFIVEDIKASTKSQRRWDSSFSPLQVGKKWFYNELRKIAIVKLKSGFDTKEYRDKLGLIKCKNKMKEVFEAHCLDAWVLARRFTGGSKKPDNKKLLCITPLQFHRRQLHRMNLSRYNVRNNYGSTRSLGLKRGSIIKHKKYGLAYVGGISKVKNRITLCSILNHSRLTRAAKVIDCLFLAFNSWTIHYA